EVAAVFEVKLIARVATVWDNCGLARAEVTAFDFGTENKVRELHIVPGGASRQEACSMDAVTVKGIVIEETNPGHSVGDHVFAPGAASVGANIEPGPGEVGWRCLVDG